MSRNKRLAMLGIFLWSSLLETVVSAAEVKSVDVRYVTDTELSAAETTKVIKGLPDKYCACGSSLVYVYRKVEVSSDSESSSTSSSESMPPSSSDETSSSSNESVPPSLSDETSSSSSESTPPSSSDETGSSSSENSSSSNSERPKTPPKDETPLESESSSNIIPPKTTDEPPKPPQSMTNTPISNRTKQLPKTGEILDILPIVSGSFLFAAAGIYLYRRKGSKGLADLLAITVVGGSLMTASYVNAYPSTNGELSSHNTIAQVSDKPAPAEIEGYEYVGYFKDDSTKLTTKEVETSVKLVDQNGNVIQNDETAYFSNAFGKSPFSGVLIYQKLQMLYPELAVGQVTQALDWNPKTMKLENKTFNLEPVVEKEALTGDEQTLFEKLLATNPAGVPVQVNTNDYVYRSQYQADNQSVSKGVIIDENLFKEYNALFPYYEQIVGYFQLYSNEYVFKSYAEYQAMLHNNAGEYGAAKISGNTVYTTTGNLMYTIDQVDVQQVDECGDLKVTYTIKVTGDYEVQSKSDFKWQNDLFLTTSTS